MSEIDDTEPPDPSLIPTEPVPGKTRFQHLRTGPQRLYSGELDTRLVERVMGPGGKSGAWHILDTYGASYYIHRRPDGSWWEVK